MQPVRRRSLVDDVVEQIRAEISSGVWAVGDRIPSEYELIERLGVSRPSVRESVRALVQLGLLETRQGDGTYVVADDATQVALRRAIGTADSHEVIQVRRALDALAAQLAAVHRSDADIDALQEHLESRQLAIRSGDSEQFITHDIAFHVGVAKASGNSLLADLYASFDASLRTSVADNSCLSRNADPDRADLHNALYRAVAAQQPDQAVAAALGLLDQQAQSLLNGQE
ncbi:FadR/GntR family transcriptional regulator [Glaciibacter psychrotolerans]|uniref:DNA-binding FadR family transcriptional regulator n=1 Tax=Glaciibacter psychrotolerans TaxID=670054 RepID=A0A7Z0ECX8_9MICO|nr:FadR/GntR family transcriptional regulator [Leifsonia psychrotolerans]NYJ18632.1 DNA-binding FadR family transcriptional regulator [Leifsonia psychrotolerans]